MRGGSSSSSNTRWCPTPEQLMVLDELYRRGLRTPNAPQIQNITAHLSLYGSIQGKNVFYWFQNHKARDRQKLRKKQLLLLHQQHQLLLHHHHFYQYPQTLHFHTPSPQNIHFQGCEEVPSAKDWPLMKTYGHDDSVMIMEVGPTFPSYSRRSNPLQTLELFPLSSPTAENHQ